MKNLLTRERGMMGVPLGYVIRIQLISDDEGDDPPFGEEDTKYTSVDMERSARAPIFSNNTN